MSISIQRLLQRVGGSLASFLVYKLRTTYVLECVDLNDGIVSFYSNIRKNHVIGDPITCAQSLSANGDTLQVRKVESNFTMHSIIVSPSELHQPRLIPLR